MMKGAVETLTSVRVELPDDVIEKIQIVKKITGIQKRKIHEFAINDYCDRIIRKDAKK